MTIQANAETARHAFDGAVAAAALTSPWWAHTIDWIGAHYIMLASAVYLTARAVEAVIGAIRKWRGPIEVAERQDDGSLRG